ncbi:DUF2945 domain-containing protein [Hymenobacter sp. BT491]|nr:DUF2945 domain-containing protein [Hymenobacter sp. BT491]
MFIIVSHCFNPHPHAMRKGTQVTWKYGTGTATGKIEEVHKEAVTRKLKGSDITRNGTADNPAFVIVQDNGDRVIKLQSEVKAATKK